MSLPMAHFNSMVGKGGVPTGEGPQRCGWVEGSDVAGAYAGVTGRYWLKVTW